MRVNRFGETILIQRKTLEILELVCFAKSILTASMLAKEMRLGRSTIIKRMKLLEELKLVESTKKHKGYSATKDASSLLQM